MSLADKLRNKAELIGVAKDDIEWRYTKGFLPYEPTIIEMEERVEKIISGKASELIWFLQHPSIYTAGTSANDKDLLHHERFQIYKSGRGGQYTYHGPGQLVVYILLNLNNRGRDIKKYVHNLEEWIISTLMDYGIKGQRCCGRPGVWVQRQDNLAKIAAIGVRVRRWVTYHGIAINMCPNLKHFEGIVPCGIPDSHVTSIMQLNTEEGRSIDLTLI